jgi:predicted PurR-regulated permease PerM
MASDNEQIEQKAMKTMAARHRLLIVWTLVGVILLAAAVLYFMGIISNAVGVIVWTVVFVFILRGPVNWLDNKGVNRTVGTLLSFVLLVIVLGLLLFIIFSPFFGINAQFQDLAKSIPTYVAAFENWANDLYSQYADVLQNDTVRDWVASAASNIAGFVQSFATTTASGMVAAGASLANTFMCIGFGLVIAFWMLVDLPKLGREAYRIVGDKYREDAQMLHLTITRVMGGYLKATIIQCAIIGVLCGILFAVLGVPSPAAIAVITGLLNIIPIVGPWLGGAMAFGASLLNSPIVGIASLLGTIVIQQLVYTFVSPKLMGDSVDIHPALTFIALMAGSGIGTAMSGLAGALVGALVSIPLIAIMKSVFVYYFEKRTGRRIVSEDGVFFKGTTPKDLDEKVDPLADATAPVPQSAPGMTGRIPSLSDLSSKLPTIDPDEKR